MGTGPLSRGATPGRPDAPDPSSPGPNADAGDGAGRVVALLLESDGPGGAEQMLLNLAGELRRRGYEVVPVGPAVGEGWLPARFRERGFEPETYRLSSPVDLRCVTDLMEIFRRRGVDVVHSHEFSMAVFGGLAARLAGLRHVITLHGGRYWAGRWRRRAALRWAFRSSAAVVAVSAASRDDLVDTLGVPREEIQVVANGVPRPQGRARPVRMEMGLDPGDPFVLSVGNLYRVKGHDVLVRALARVAGARPGLRWKAAVAGRGEEEGRLRGLAAEGGVVERIDFLGFRDDVGALLAAADVFVMPSRSEGLPLALLEAMHAGVAVIATEVGGVPEVVTDGEEALLVPPGDVDALAQALLRVLEDDELRARLVARARRRAEERYSVRSMTDAYEALYGPDVSGDARRVDAGAGAEERRP